MHEIYLIQGLGVVQPDYIQGGHGQKRWYAVITFTTLNVNMPGLHAMHRLCIWQVYACIPIYVARSAIPKTEHQLAYQTIPEEGCANQTNHNWRTQIWISYRYPGRFAVLPVSPQTFVVAWRHATLSEFLIQRKPSVARPQFYCSGSSGSGSISCWPIVDIC